MVRDPPLVECPDCGHHLNWFDSQTACSDCNWWAQYHLKGWASLDQMPDSAMNRFGTKLAGAELGDLVVVE